MKGVYSMDTVQENKASMSTAIACGVIMFLHMGTTTMISALLPNIVADLKISLTQASIALVIGLVSGVVFSFIGSKLINKMTPKWALALGSVFVGVNLVLYSIMPNLTFLFIASIFTGGIFAFGAHTSIAGIISNSYGSRMAPILGVIFGAAAFGNAVTSLLVGQMLGPIGWRNTFLVIGLSFSIISLLANILFIRNPKNKRVETADSSHSVTKEAEVEGLMLKQAIKTPSFILFCIAMILAAALYAGFIAYATTFWQGYGMEASVSISNVGILSAFAALVVMSSGFIVKKFGSRILMLLIFILYALGIVAMSIWTQNQGTLLLILGMFFIAFAMPAQSLPSLVLPELFGMKDYNSINSFGLAFYYVGCAVALTMVPVVVSVTGSFLVSHYMLAAFAVLALILFLLSLKMSPIKKLKKMASSLTED